MNSHTAHLLAAAKPIPTGEKIFACCVIVLFGLIGMGLLRAGLSELIKVRRRRPFLIKLPGTILTVIKERETRAGTPGSRRDTGQILKYIPHVAFTTPEGKRVEFRSEVCQIHELRRKYGGSFITPECPWLDGDAVEVHYDPGGVLKPFIGDGKSAGIAWPMLAAGLVAIGASVGMGFVFWAKVFH